MAKDIYDIILYLENTRYTSLETFMLQKSGQKLKYEVRNGVAFLPAAVHRG